MFDSPQTRFDLLPKIFLEFEDQSIYFFLLRKVFSAIKYNNTQSISELNLANNTLTTYKTWPSWNSIMTNGDKE